VSATQTFSIPRYTGIDASTGEPLVPGAGMVVVLLERAEDDDLDRLDFDLSAWERGVRPDSDRRLFASWRTTVPEPGKKRESLISADGLVDLFEQLAETEDPRRLAFRYVLALMLVRKRLLVYAGTDAGDLLVRPKGSDPEADPVRVHDPQAAGELDEQTLSELADQVEQVLDRNDG